MEIKELEKERDSLRDEKQSLKHQISIHQRNEVEALKSAKDGREMVHEPLLEFGGFLAVLCWTCVGLEGEVHPTLFADSQRVPVAFSRILTLWGTPTGGGSASKAGAAAESI